MIRLLPLLLLLFLTAAERPSTQIDVSVVQPGTTGIVYNVANAPAWAPSVNYTHVGHFGDRVLAGPALTPGATPSYTDEQPLYLLELTQAGTSAASQPNINACPSTVSDGTAVWNCLTKVNYVTLASAMVDDPVEWQPNTGYYHHQFVRKDKIVWWPQNDNHYTTFDPAPHQCVSGTTGPDINVIGSNSEHPDGDPTLGCFWIKAGDIPYSSSHANAWPHGLFSDNAHLVMPASGMQSRRFRLWHGGAGRPEYGPAATAYHATTDGVMCPDGVTSWWETAGQGCSPKQQFSWIIEAAPGEGICESPGPLVYDNTRGVAIFADGSEAFHAGDFMISLSCLQFKNVNTNLAAVSAFEGTGPNSGNTFLDRSIVDSSGASSFTSNGGAIALNSLIINRSNLPAPSAVLNKYITALINTTIVMTGSGPDRTYYLQECDNSFTTAAVITGNILVGGAHSIGQYGIVGDPANWCSPIPWPSTLTKNNVTDLLTSTDAATPTHPLDSLTGVGPVTAAPLGGTSNLYGQSAASLFVDPARDFRLKADSPAKGVGVAGNAPFEGLRPTSNTLDFFAVTRAPSYSAGAVQ